jgi:hypothetical protein
VIFLYFLPWPNSPPDTPLHEGKLGPMSLAWRYVAGINGPECFGLLWAFSPARILRFLNPVFTVHRLRVD